MIVVWTDETGDDSAKLESTIELCRRNQATVAVVGPSSVLGADTGLHSYRDPKTKRTYQLPVLKGPDAATPERLNVDYWFGSKGPGRGGSPSWYGGPQLYGMASGFSPYALTRLALQTSGEYTIFDRPTDRGPFELARMKKYLPEYHSVAEYERDLAKHPLRQAVMRAVRVTQADPVTTPTMIFFAKKPPRSQPNVIPHLLSTGAVCRQDSDGQGRHDSSGPETYRNRRSRWRI